VDFALILVVATAVAGLVWGLDIVWWRRSRTAGAREPVVVDYARSFFPILLLVLVVRSFLFEPFRIPSSSMMPTLLIGDFIFVNKYTYGLRLPVVNTRILEVGAPRRGDVVVFRLPADPSTNYIKRLVGLPGDTILYAGKKLYVNGEPVSLSPVGIYDGEGQPGALLVRERLGEVEHQILLMPGMQSAEGTFVVPPGYFFMMGDNRDNSRDSRYEGVGFIPEDHIVGRAVRIWLNWDFPGLPDWSRIGGTVR
jgi:signal peptidase I